MTIKLRIKRCYKAVDYEVEASFEDPQIEIEQMMETVDTIVSLIEKIERFIDRSSVLVDGNKSHET